MAGAGNKVRFSDLGTGGGFVFRPSWWVALKVSRMVVVTLECLRNWGASRQPARWQNIGREIEAKGVFGVAGGFLGACADVLRADVSAELFSSC